MQRTSAPTLATEPSPAERARTLALGVVTGVVHLAEPDQSGTRAYRVQQLTAPDGTIALLVRVGSDLHDRLQAVTGSIELVDVPSVLDVLDVPPGQLCLPRARLCVTGWLEEPEPAEQRALAGQIAAARPLGKLLDVGEGWTLYRLDVGEIRVTTGTGTHVVDPLDFAAAEPDPLYESEDHVVGHLEAHHRDQTVGYALRQLPGAPVRASVSEVMVVGLDRYGLDLLCAVGDGYCPLRASFSCPVSDDESLSRALTALLGAPGPG